MQALMLEREAGRFSNFRVHSIKGDDARCRELTGLSWVMFDCLATYLVPFMEYTMVNLRKEDQLFIVLVKQNPSAALLSLALGMGKTTLKDMFTRWIDLMHAKLSFLVHWPDRDALSSIPPAFKALYPRLTAIVDCFEIRMDSPRAYDAR